MLDDFQDEWRVDLKETPKVWWSDVRTKQKALRRLAAERKWPGTDQAISIDIWSFNVVINLDKWPSTFWKKKRRGGPQHNKTKAQSVSMFFVCLSGVRLYFPLVFLFCFLIVDNSLAILIDSGGGHRRCRIKPERGDGKIFFLIGLNMRPGSCLIGKQTHDRLVNCLPLDASWWVKRKKTVAR